MSRYPAEGRREVPPLWPSVVGAPHAPLRCGPRSHPIPLLCRRTQHWAAPVTSSCLSNTKHWWVAQRYSHFWIFRPFSNFMVNLVFDPLWPISNFMVNSSLWHWVCRASGKNITVFAHENQAVLSPSRSYTKQTNLDLKRMCSRCQRKRQRRGWGETPRGDTDSRENLPREKRRGLPECLNTSTVLQRHGWQQAPTSPNTLRPSSQHEISVDPR